MPTIQTPDILIILDIFSRDENLHLYCDPDYLVDKNKVGIKIFKRIQEALRDYKESYYIIDPVRKYFMVWVFAHGEWILYSFGLHPDRRNRENLLELWRAIIGQHDKFLCYLYSNNTRAINWLKKCGMKEIGKLVERQDKIAIKLLLDKSDNGDMV